MNLPYRNVSIQIRIYLVVFVKVVSYIEAVLN